MASFIQEYRADYGVERICELLPIAPSTHNEHKAREADPSRWLALARRDAELRNAIQRVFDENFSVYGVRKVWRQRIRESIAVARCTVARLMVGWGVGRVVWGRRFKTTVGDGALVRPADKVNRVFHAARPNALWVSDLTYVANCRGFAYVAFGIVAHARRIVGWRASTSLRNKLALDALEQALYDRSVSGRDNLIHRSDSGSQYLSICYTERLVEAGIEPSVGSVGDSYDNALAETVIGLYKTEVIRLREPWRHVQSWEFATLEWVDWFNHRRVLGSNGDVPPAELGAIHHQQFEESAKAA